MEYSSDAASAILNITKENLDRLISNNIEGAKIVDGEYTVTQEQLNALLSEISDHNKKRRAFGLGEYDGKDKYIIVDDDKIISLHREIDSHNKSIESLSIKIDKLSERISEHESEANGKCATIKKLVRSNYPETVGVMYDVIDDRKHDLLILNTEDNSITREEFSRKLNELMREGLRSRIISKDSIIGPFQGRGD